MKDFANKYLEKYNGFSKVVRILLCLLWDIPSTLYRFSKSALKDNTLGMILAVLIGIFGGWIIFIIDIITLAVKDKIFWLDELGVDEDKMAEALKSDDAAEETETAAAEENAQTEEAAAEEAPAEEAATEEAQEESAEAVAVDGEEKAE